MKTVIIYDQLDADVKFVVLDGDYTHLNHVYVNVNQYIEDKKLRKAQKLQDEFTNLFFSPDDGKDLQTYLTEFPTQEVLDGAAVIVAGFLP